MNLQFTAVTTSSTLAMGQVQNVAPIQSSLPTSASVGLSFVLLIAFIGAVNAIPKSVRRKPRQLAEVHQTGGLLTHF